MTHPEFVFGYGSLVAAGALPTSTETDPPGHVAELTGFARAWGVAMDNSVDLPGYKFYLEPGGHRPSVFVAFLDLVADPAPDARVTGVCRPVDHSELTRLDRRERNYVRVDVSDHLDSCTGLDPPAGRVWAYIGSQAGRARLREGRRRGAAVIHAGYLRTVRAGLTGLDAAASEAFEASLDPGGLPVVELDRRELAPVR